MSWWLPKMLHSLEVLAGSRTWEALQLVCGRRWSAQMFILFVPNVQPKGRGSVFNSLETCCFRLKGSKTKYEIPPAGSLFPLTQTCLAPELIPPPRADLVSIYFGTKALFNSRFFNKGQRQAQLTRRKPKPPKQRLLHWFLLIGIYPSM